MKRKILACILTLSLISGSLSGCGAAGSAADSSNISNSADIVRETAAPETEEDVISAEGETEGQEEDLSDAGHDNGSPWLNSCLIGNVKEDTPTDPKQDLHLYANKDWLLNAEIEQGHSAVSNYSLVAKDTTKKAIEMLHSDELSGHDAELIQGLFRLYEDFDARNKAGYEPIEKAVEKILAVKSLDDIKAVFLDDAIKYDVENLIGVSVETGISDSDNYYVYIFSPGLIMSDSADYAERTEYGTMLHDFNKDVFIYIAGRLGIDENKAVSYYEDAIGLETKLASHIYTNEEEMRSDYMERINNVMSLDEAAALVKAYPLKEVVEANGLIYKGDYIVVNPDYISFLDEIFTEDNVEELKNYIFVKYCLREASLLDEETMQTRVKLYNQYFGTSGDQSIDEKGYTIVENSLAEPLAREYIKMYSSEEDRKRVEDVCYKVIDTYREILSANDWASKETIDYAIKKLDSITVNVGWPNKWKDYSKLDIEGLSYYDAAKKIDNYNMELEKNLLGTKPDKEMWASGFSVLSCNAFYNFSDNSINMIVGMMGEPFYYSDMPVEELYASLGAFWIGHEISHAFDSNGAQYDIDGNLNNWWTEEDYSKFESKVKKMDDYLDGILIMDDYYVNGSNVDSEMIADMTGLQCALKMAEKEKDFDYKKFFEYFARMNVSAELYSYELSMIQGDVHPVNYQRTNVPVQQFEEFYAAYGVTEGDGMYLSPEDRLIIW